MTLAAIDWLSISINLLLVIFVIVCLLMTLLILMQRPKQEGLGAAFGAGVTDQVFGARTTNVLQRGTVYLGSLFFLLALVLAILIGHKNKTVSMLEAAEPAAAKAEQTAPAEVKEEQVKPKSLSEELPVETSVETPATETAPPAAQETPTPSPEPAAPTEATKPADEAAPAPAGDAPAPSEEKSGQP